MKLVTEKTHKLYDRIVATLGSYIKGSRFENHVYTVGGCERDRLLGLPIKDIDLVIDLPNGGIALANWLHEQGHTVFSPVVYENYGTAMFCLKEFPDFELETVQTRKESYRDMTTRNPETAFGTIEEDCIRRDFTVNAIYRNISTGELMDFTGMGLNDIKLRIIRSCDDPNIIFREDPLRIMRAIRFSAKLGWEIEDRTYQGLYDNVDRLEIVSRERITDEFSKILSYDNVMHSLFELKKIGALKYVSKELSELSDSDFNDSVNGIRYTSPGALNRMPILFQKTNNTEQALKDMKYSNTFVDDVMKCIQAIPIIQSLGPEYKDVNTVTVRKLQYKMKSNTLMNIAILCAHSINNKDNLLVRGNQQAIHVYARNLRLVLDKTDCFSFNLPIDGNDIMDYLQISPGPEVKKYVEALREAYFKNPKITSEDCYKILDDLSK